MDANERLKLLISKADRSQRKIAADIGISAARLNNYVQGVRVISNNMLLKIAEYTGCNPNWLLTGQGEMFVSPVLPAVELVSIELVGEIAAGAPFPIVENDHKKYINVPSGLLSRPGRYYAFQVRGSSMEPVLPDGDLAIISTDWSGLRSLNNRIFAFRTADGITLKKLVLNHRSKQGFLFPVNPAYDPIPYDKNNTDIVMIGILILSLRYYNI